MGWIGWVRCKKFRCDFVARTFALIAPVQPVLHWVLCSNETIQTLQNSMFAPVQPIFHRVLCSNETFPNAPKYYETHQNMSLGSNGADRVHSLRKIPMRLRCTIFREFYAVTKCSQMHPNITKRSRTWVQDAIVWIGSLCCEKFQRDFVAGSFALIALVRLDLHFVSCNNELVPNAPKHYKMH